MKKFCEAEESIDMAESQKKKDKRRLYMKRCREAESTHKAATRKNNDNASKKKNAKMKVLMQPQHKKTTTMHQRKKMPK